jgi:uncharacterized protein (TIGR02246 family)
MNIRFRSTLFLAAMGGALLLLTAWGQTPQMKNSSADALRALEKQWNQDLASKKLDRIVSYYADDAVLMGPGEPPSPGIAAIRKTIAELLKDPAISLKFQAARVEIAGSGDLGFTQGSYEMTMTDPQSKHILHDRGSYVTTYRKQANGSWKAVADIASSEFPPAPPMPMNHKP